MMIGRILLNAAPRTIMPPEHMHGTMLVVALFGLVAVVLWLWSLVHCIRNKGLSDNMRLIGVLLIVFLGLLGSLIYLVLPRNHVNA